MVFFVFVRGEERDSGIILYILKKKKGQIERTKERKRREVKERERENDGIRREDRNGQKE